MKLIGDFKHWIRWHSMQLALLAAAMATYFTENPDQWERIIALMPEWVKPFTGVALFLVLWWARMRPQGGKPLTGGDDAGQ